MGISMISVILGKSAVPTVQKFLWCWTTSEFGPPQAGEHARWEDTVTIRRNPKTKIQIFSHIQKLYLTILMQNMGISMINVILGKSAVPTVQILLWYWATSEFGPPQAGEHARWESDVAMKRCAKHYSFRIYFVIHGSETPQRILWVQSKRLNKYNDFAILK